MLIHAPAVRPDALLRLRARSGVTESSALSTLASRELATPSARDSSRPLMPRRTTYSRLRTSPGCRGRRMVPRLDGVDRGGRRIVYLHSRPRGAVKADCGPHGPGLVGWFANWYPPFAAAGGVPAGVKRRGTSARSMVVASSAPGYRCGARSEEHTSELQSHSF